MRTLTQKSFFITAFLAFSGFLPSSTWADDEEIDPKLSQFIMDTDSRFNSLESQIADLRGQIEKSAHANKILKSQLDRALQDVEFRLNEKAQDSVEDSSESVDIPETAGTPKEAYNQALSLYNDEKYDAAVKSFKNFIKDHPKDPLLGNALYWQGEAYYAKGDYENASIQFADVYQRHKKSSKAPDSLVKLALSLKAQKKQREACTVIQQFPKDFPKAAGSIHELAQKVQKDLKCTAG